jgi:hypothetical protein
MAKRNQGGLMARHDSGDHEFRGDFDGSKRRDPHAVHDPRHETGQTLADDVKDIITGIPGSILGIGAIATADIAVVVKNANVKEILAAEGQCLNVDLSTNSCGESETEEFVNNVQRLMKDVPGYQEPLENAIYVRPITNTSDLGQRLDNSSDGIVAMGMEDIEVLVPPVDGEKPTGSQSLNAGNELDDEPVIKNEDIFTAPIVPGEMPELREDVDLIVSIESQLVDLGYLLKDVGRSKGMNKSFALEAEKLLPGFGGGVPVGYYTEALSATRYKASLEELSNSIWALIGAAIAATLAVIVKIYSYFSGKKKGEEGDKSSAVDNLAAQMRTAAADISVLDETASIVQDADKLLAHANIVLKNEHGHEYNCDSFQAIINNVFTDDERYGRAKKFLNSRDPILHDIINNGAYSQAAVEIGNKLSLANAAIIAKMDLIDQAIRSDLGSTSVSSEMKNTRILTIAEKPLELTVSGRTMSLRETADYLKNTRAELAEKQISNPITFDRLFITMAQAYKLRSVDRLLHQLSNSVIAAGQMHSRLEKMQSVSRTLSVDGTPGATTQGVGEHLRQVLFTTARDVAGLGLLASEVSYYASNLDHLAREALGFAVEVVRKTSTEMRRNKQDIPEGWQKVIDRLAMQQKAIADAYRNR